MSFIELGTALP